MDNTPQKYNSIDMPMSVFMNAFCDGDLSEVENFEDIRIDYTLAIGGNELINSLQDTLSYEKLKMKIQLAKALIASIDLRKYIRGLADEKVVKLESVRLLCKSFELKSDEQIFDELKSLNYHMMVPGADLENADNYCRQINGWIMNDVVTLSELEKEKKDSNKSQKENRVQDRNYFTDIFIAINSALHLSINENSSVRMFCRAAVQYINHCERQMALNQKES